MDQQTAVFDWIEARLQCSVEKVFAALKADAQKNVDTFNAATEPDKHQGRWVFDSNHPDHFMIFRGRLGARFSLQDDHIAIEQMEGKRDRSEPILVTTALTHEGQCRLVLGSKQLERWQLLREVLEPFLFAHSPNGGA